MPVLFAALLWHLMHETGCWPGCWPAVCTDDVLAAVCTEPAHALDLLQAKGCGLASKDLWSRLITCIDPSAASCGQPASAALGMPSFLKFSSHWGLVMASRSSCQVDMYYIGYCSCLEYVSAILAWLFA
jgi:hypothetical protein